MGVSRAEGMLDTPAPALTRNMRDQLMSKASHTLKPADLTSKLDRRSWSRELWRDAYAMARRMIRARGDYTCTDALGWYNDHATRRFGTASSPVVIAAGSLVFHERVLANGVIGSVAELERQGLVRPTRKPRPGNLTATVPCRAVRLARLRSPGFSIAWTFDKLAAAGLRRSARAWEARQRREREASFFALTLAGAIALPPS